jgi:DeoR family transcriptional regulator of aga operon
MPGSSNSFMNEERLRAIGEFVRKNGRAFVRDLAVTFKSSEVTIRRDLDILQKRGLLYRTHGGALRIESDFSLTERELKHPSEKYAIALAASRMVRDGQSIILGAGSTTTAIARVMHDFKNVTVITNGISIASELANSNVDVILTAGLLRKHSYSVVGPLAEQALSRLKADIFFMGIDGIDSRVGFFMQNMLGAQLARVMVEMASRTIVVCDSSKFGRTGLSTIIPIDQVDGLITDSQVPDFELAALRKAGVEVTVV